MYSDDGMYSNDGFSSLHNSSCKQTPWDQPGFPGERMYNMAASRDSLCFRGGLLVNGNFDAEDSSVHDKIWLIDSRASIGQYALVQTATRTGHHSALALRYGSEIELDNCLPALSSKGLVFCSFKLVLETTSD